MFHLLLLLVVLLLRPASRTDDELVLMMADARCLYEWMRKLNKIDFSKKIYFLTYIHDPRCLNSDRKSCQMFAVDLFCFMSFKKSIHVLYELLKILREPRMLEWWRWDKIPPHDHRRANCVKHRQKCDVSKNTSHWWSGLNEKKIYWSEICSHS